MRIVDVCAFYAPRAGGVRTYIDAKLRSASRLGHELVVIVPGSEDKTVEISSGAVITTLACPRFQLDRRYRYFNDRERLHRELTRWRPDHVECSSPWSSATMVAEWPGSATRSLFMHSDPVAAHGYRILPMCSHSVVDRLFSRFWHHLRTLGRSFDSVICPSRQLSHRLASRGVAGVTTLPLGISGDFSPERRNLELREQLLGTLGLGADGLLLLGVGRLGAEKQWEMVVDRVSAAAEGRKIGLLLVGDGPRRASVVRSIAGSPRIRLIEPISDRARFATLMASADGLVHGCNAETYGLVIAEARASGLPLIVPDGGGALEQLQQGAGLAYSSRAAGSLEHAIIRLYEEREPLRRLARRRSHVPMLEWHFQQLFDHFEQLSGLYFQSSEALRAAA